MKQMDVQVGVVAALLVLFLSATSPAHILFLHPLASPSHLVVSWPLVSALHTKGHRITVISPVNPPSTPSPLHNVTLIIPKTLRETYEEFSNNDFSLTSRLSGLALPLFLVGSYIKYAFTEALLSSSEVKDWVTSDPQVDLVVTDLIPDFGVGLARQLKSKVILFQMVAFPWEILEMYGAPIEMVSSMEFPRSNPLSFFQRVTYVFAIFLNKLSAKIGWIFANRLHAKYLTISEDSPRLPELLQDVSVVLHNGHFLEEFRKPFPPNFVSVPGLHIQETHNPLSKEIEEFIGSFKGFFYISLGTIVKLENLPESTKEDFFSAFRAFPDYAFLWKWDVERPKDVPSNLYFAKWFQQQDVLVHKKILGFVTQAGRPSMQEALYNAVPTITLPVIVDQDYNAVMAEELGVSISLEIASVTKDQLVAAFRRLVNREFEERSREVSKIMKDVPMKPVDTAVWWVEYLLRHNDTSHLRPLTADQPLVVRWLLDVWIFLAFLSIFTSWMTFRVGRFIIRNLCTKRPVKIKKR